MANSAPSVPRTGAGALLAPPEVIGLLPARASVLEIALPGPSTGGGRAVHDGPVERLVRSASELSMGNPRSFPRAECAVMLGVLDTLIEETGRGAKSFLAALLSRTPHVILDITPTATSPPNAQKARGFSWASDAQMVRDLFSGAQAVQRHPRASGQGPDLWSLHGAAAPAPPAPPPRAQRQGPVTLVTDVDFWWQNAGHRVRISAMVRYLARVCDLRVVCLHPDAERRASAIADTIRPATFVPCPAEVGRAWPDLAHWLRAEMTRHAPSRAIVHYAYLHWVTDLVPPQTLTVLDTHDMLALRRHRFKLHDQTAPIDVDEETEAAWHAKFDRIAFIQRGELTYGQRYLHPARTLLCPHPVEVRRVEPRKTVRSIGFFGSAARPNVDGMEWFFDAVFPTIDAPGVDWRIAGGVCNALGRLPCGVRLCGPVDRIEDFYEGIDIVIVPLRFGGGLKIKTVEALGFGIPIVSTPAGVDGLCGGHGVRVAADAPAFAAALQALIAAPLAEREALSHVGHRYASKWFSPQTCFDTLLDAEPGAEPNAP